MFDHAESRYNANEIVTSSAKWRQVELVGLSGRLLASLFSRKGPAGLSKIHRYEKCFAVKFSLFSCMTNLQRPISLTIAVDQTTIHT